MQQSPTVLFFKSQTGFKQDQVGIPTVACHFFQDLIASKPSQLSGSSGRPSEEIAQKTVEAQVCWANGSIQNPRFFGWLVGWLGFLLDLLWNRKDWLKFVDVFGSQV